MQILCLYLDSLFSFAFCSHPSLTLIHTNCFQNLFRSFPFQGTMAMKSLKQMLKLMTCEWGKPPTLLFQFNPPPHPLILSIFFHSQLLGIYPIGRTLLCFPRSQSDMRISKVRRCCFHTDFLELSCRNYFTKPWQQPTHAMNFKMKFMQHDLRGPERPRRQPNTYSTAKVTKVHKYEESAMANICKIVENTRNSNKNTHLPISSKCTEFIET